MVQEDDRIAESPTTQLEKQLKYAAGADSPRNESPQWRLIAEHIVKRSEVGLVPCDATASPSSNFGGFLTFQPPDLAA